MYFDDDFENVDYDSFYENEDRYSRAPNPLYYHTQIEYCEVLHETDKALLILYEHEDDRLLELWIPKSIIRNREATTMWVHREIFNSIVERHD